MKQTTHKCDIDIFLGKESQNTQIFSNFIDQIMPDSLLYSKIEGVIDQAVPVSAAPYFTAPVSKTCLSPNDLQKCPNGNKVISIYLVDQTAHTKSSKSSFLMGNNGGTILL